mmetsp:Transcript_19288/g.22046  ORF Transcript_19288/g.22046 Transcript_19288/m.22046 type:complete len:209 (+) Transcript_19288:1910-2536(+)
MHSLLRGSIGVGLHLSGHLLLHCTSRHSHHLVRNVFSLGIAIKPKTNMISFSCQSPQMVNHPQFSGRPFLLLYNWHSEILGWVLGTLIILLLVEAEREDVAHDAGHNDFAGRRLVVLLNRSKSVGIECIDWQSPGYSTLLSWTPGTTQCVCNCLCYGRFLCHHQYCCHSISVSRGLLILSFAHQKIRNSFKGEHSQIFKPQTLISTPL